MTTRQEELQYIHTHYPGFLEQFLIAMEEGRIEGDFFGNAACGCFYGHLFSDISSDIMPQVWRVREDITGNRYESTPIEEFIAGVTSDDTPETNDELRGLKVAIEEIILPAKGRP